jgi:hypothetical protein
MTEFEERRATTCDMPHERGCTWADEAADRAVQKTFAILGVDVNAPESVEKFRQDLRFGGDMRSLAEKGKIASVMVFVTFIISAIGYGIIEMIKVKMGGQ